MLIAIDGPAASGKGTLARRLADRLGLPHLDTGLLYRAVAHAMLQGGTSLSDPAAAERAAHALDLKRLDPGPLRGRHMGEAASLVSVHAGVREALLGLQRRFGTAGTGAVLDGRDIGTVVCPDADVKLFVTASPEERARRRHRELVRSDEPVDYNTVLDDILLRDARDRSRREAPLRMAADAILLDTTALDADAAFSQALAVVEAARVGA